jgi:hypothetical protein
MILAPIGNAFLGFFLLTVVLGLLAGAIVRSRADEHRLARAARQTRQRRRSTSASRPRTDWVAHPDAF